MELLFIFLVILVGLIFVANVFMIFSGKSEDFYVVWVFMGVSLINEMVIKVLLCLFFVYLWYKYNVEFNIDVQELIVNEIY
jgi:hypothetical protein